NYSLVNNKEHKLSVWLNWLSIFGLIYLAGFAIFFLVYITGLLS
ncbi:MAG: divalent metal cation transporter, partial [Streptococcus mutans]